MAKKEKKNITVKIADYQSDEFQMLLEKSNSPDAIKITATIAELIEDYLTDYTADEKPFGREVTTTAGLISFSRIKPEMTTVYEVTALDFWRMITLLTDDKSSGVEYFIGSKVTAKMTTISAIAEMVEAGFNNEFAGLGTYTDIAGKVHDLDVKAIIQEIK